MLKENGLPEINNAEKIDEQVLEVINKLREEGVNLADVAYNAIKESIAGKTPEEREEILIRIHNKSKRNLINQSQAKTNHELKHRKYQRD